MRSSIPTLSSRPSSFLGRCPCFLSLLLLHVLLANNNVVLVQAIDDVWRALDLANSQEMAGMMTSYQMQMRAQDDIEFDMRSLSSPMYTSSGSSTTGSRGLSSKLGARCGNRNTCAMDNENDDVNNTTMMNGDIGDDDLQCTPVALGKRCLPVTCLERGLEDAHAQFGGDMEAYQQTIFDAAGVTKEDLRQALQGVGNDKRNFLQTNVFQALQKALEAHAAPADAIFGVYDNCTTTGVGTPTPLELKRVTYLGLHLEGGVLPLDVAFDVFWEYDAPSSNAFVRYCIGAAGPGGAEISFLYLIAQNTDDPDAISETCSVVADVDFGIGAIFGVGYGHGLSNNLGQLELTAGVGLKVSAGVGFCGVSKA